MMVASLKGLIVRDLQKLFSSGALAGLSDGQLVERYVDRREEAVFEAIVHRHGPMAWGVCRRVLRDHHDAKDAFQATFLVLARKASSILPREMVGNWLHGVAYQTAVRARAITYKCRGREGQAPEMPEPEAAMLAEGRWRPDLHAGHLRVSRPPLAGRNAASLPVASYDLRFSA